MTAAKRVGENLKRLRESQGITMRELSELTGVSTQTIVDYEKGVGALKIATLEQFAAAIGVPVREILELPVATAAGAKLLKRFKASEWHALASVTPEEERWIREHAAEYLGDEEPPAKAVWLLILARRERK